MINEKLDDFSINSNAIKAELIVNQTEVQNLIAVDNVNPIKHSTIARHKVYNRWFSSWTTIDGTESDQKPFMPIICPIVGHKTDNNSNNNNNNNINIDINNRLKVKPKKQTMSPLLNQTAEQLSDEMKHAIDVINSVALSYNELIPNNQSETNHQLLTNNCLNSNCLVNCDLSRTNTALKDCLAQNETKSPLDMMCLSLQSIESNANNHLNHLKCEKLTPIKKINQKTKSSTKSSTKSPNQQSKQKLKIKLFNFPINNYSKANTNGVCDKDFDNKIVPSFDSPFDSSLIGKNVYKNKNKMNSILIKSETRIKDNGMKRIKPIAKKNKKMAINTNNNSNNNPFLNSYQNFLQSNNKGINLGSKKPKMKYFIKKKSESQIHAEKAVKKSRGIKSNSVKIKKNLKPSVVKNFTEQKSFLAFIDQKFPPIKEGVAFIQDRACKDFHSGISLCLDCNEAKRESNDSNTCRFYKYRTLIKNGDVLSVYAFAEELDATKEDSKIWLPLMTVSTINDVTARFLLTFVGQQFCRTYTEELEVIKNSNLSETTWKKPVKGIRELCDVCQTTIFNTHWVCPICGYAVCIDCYKSRVIDKEMSYSRKNYDEYGWLLCNNRVKHDMNHFHLALFITKSVYGSVNDALHTVKNALQIQGTCDCGLLVNSIDIASTGRLSSSELKNRYRDIPHQWYCDERLLILSDPKCVDNIKIFQIHWLHGDPVMIQNVHLTLDNNLWTPQAFNRDFGKQTSRLVDCMNGNIIPKTQMRYFWDGFEDTSKRLEDKETGEQMLLKLKDWPPNAEFRDKLPQRFDDLMDNMPLPEYTRYNGIRNLSSRLPDFFVRPDLGPKMYCAYGSVTHPDKGTTNLHLDMSDAINVMIYVGIAKHNDKPIEQHFKDANEALMKGGCDQQMINRVNECGRSVGALWHIFRAQDANKIRHLLTKVALERGHKIELNNDPIHDQSWYLDDILRKRLYEEYGVKGFAVAQCLGDAILIPAGAPHQVQNLHSCIKVAGEFVSPENVAHCVSLTHEFRKLSKRHNNHEDKLQIKNIIYHSVKDSITTLYPYLISQEFLSGAVRTTSNTESSPLSTTTTDIKSRNSI